MGSGDHTQACMPRAITPEPTLFPAFVIGSESGAKLALSSMQSSCPSAIPNCWDHSHKPPLLVLCCVKDQTQGLMRARQALYPLSYSSGTWSCFWSIWKDPGHGLRNDEWNRIPGKRSIGQVSGILSGCLSVTLYPAYRVSLLCLSPGPAKDIQPTMKFVMDTSKYWFKPSISREQGKTSPVS